MAQRGVTWFLLMMIYWKRTSGQEACFSNDLTTMMVRLRNFQTKYHDTIAAMQEQISKEDRRNSVLELEIADLKTKNFDLEKNVQSLTQTNQQQQTEIESLKVESSLFEIEIRNLTQEGIEHIEDLTKKSLDLEKKVRNLIITSDTRIATIQEQIEELEMNYAILDNETRTIVQETEENMADLTVKILDLENSVQNLSTSTDTKIKAIQEKIEKLDINDSNLENEIRILTQENIEQIADVTEESVDLETSVRNLTITTHTKITTVQAYIANLETNTSLAANETKELTTESLDQLTDLTAESIDMEINIRNLSTGTATKLTIIQEQMGVFEVEMSDLKEEDLELDNEVKNLTRENQQHEKDIERLKSGVSVEKIVFQARLQNITQSTGDIVVFTTEDFDTQNSYDNSTGKFTAPASGTYLFSVQLCQKYNGRDLFFTVKSSKPLNNVHASVFHYGYASSSVTTIIELKKSEAVWVEIESVIDWYYKSNDSCWSLFLGTLLGI